MRISIKKVHADDYERLKLVKPSLKLSDFNSRMAKQEAGTAEFLYLEVDNSPVCIAFLKFFGKQTHPEYPDIEDIYTKVDERGKGYATQIIDACERKALKYGFNKIGLAVNPTENGLAMRLYEKLGYKSDGKEKYIDAVYGGIEDWVIDMEKNISSK